MSLSAQRSLDTPDLTTGLAIVSSTATGPADSPQPAPPSVSTDAAPQPHYVVVVNSNAGSSSKFSEDALKAASPDATFDILSVAPDGLDAAFDKAFGEQPTAVIVVGGDGTARTAAVRAVQTGVPIIPMPGGTMNVLPKIVFGHGDMTRAIADLPRLRPIGLDVGRVSGEMFFLSAAFGLAGPMARLREATRSEHKFDRVMKAAGALMKSIRPSLECRVRWRTPNEKWRNAHSLIVALGDIDRILSPDSEDHGSRLEVAALRLRSVWQMFAFGAAFVSGAWRNSKNLKIVRAREVEIIVPSKRPLIVLDGEPVRVSRVGTVTLERRALPVLAMPLDQQDSATAPGAGK